MTIAVQFSYREKEVHFIDQFIYTCFSILAKTHPEINFLFITDDIVDAKNLPYPNQKLISLPPGINNSVVRNFWYQFKLPAILKKHAVEYFVNNKNYYIRKTKTKQIVWIDKTAVLNNKRKVARLSDYQMILTVNEYFKNISIATIPEIEKKLIVTGVGFNHLLSLNHNIDIEEIKNKYSDGADYFVCCSDSNQFDELMICLKAFSQFKKWQQSNMQLLFLLNDQQKNKLSKLLSTYKYKLDVKLIDKQDSFKNNEIMAGAYSIINTNTANSISANMLTALQLNKPLMVADLEYFKSSFADAAVYTKIDENEIAKKMILLYKDENYRNDIIENTRQLITTSDWVVLAERLWSRIMTSSEN